MATFGQRVQFGPYNVDGAPATIKIYHYAAGTSTLSDVWSDREKTTTEAQPVESDLNGIVSFFADGIYQFRIDAATDGITYSTLYTYDNWAIGDEGTFSGEGAAIVSASTLTLGTDGNFFHVTGNTGPITAISGTQDTVTLVFDGTPTLAHSGNLVLEHNIDYLVVARDIFTFVNDGGGVWRETGRSSSKGHADNVFTIHDAADPTKEVIFEVGNITTATTRTQTVQDEDGTLALTSEFAYSNLAGAPGRLALPTKYITGLTYFNNVADSTNDLDIVAGSCRDATDAHNIILTALTKKSDVAWAVGTDQGALDTGAVANSDYYIWAIKRADTGVCDILFSLSSTSPTMPADYGFKRLIGWFKRVGGTIVSFVTYELEGGGIEHLWRSVTLDINLSNTLTTARRTDAVKVPLTFSVIAHMNVRVGDAGSAQETYICCPDATDQAPSITVSPLANAASLTGYTFAELMSIRTSATGTIAARSTIATVDLYAVCTLGFTWARRN